MSCFYWFLVMLVIAMLFLGGRGGGCVSFVVVWQSKIFLFFFFFFFEVSVLICINIRFCLNSAWIVQENNLKYHPASWVVWEYSKFMWNLPKFYIFFPHFVTVTEQRLHLWLLHCDVWLVTCWREISSYVIPWLFACWWFPSCPLSHVRLLW